MIGALYLDSLQSCDYYISIPQILEYGHKFGLVSELKLRRCRHHGAKGSFIVASAALKLLVLIQCIPYHTPIPLLSYRRFQKQLAAAETIVDMSRSINLCHGLVDEQFLQIQSHRNCLPTPEFSHVSIAILNYLNEDTCSARMRTSMQNCETLELVFQLKISISFVKHFLQDRKSSSAVP